MLYRIINSKQNVKHDSVDDIIKVHILHCFFQRHISALVMRNPPVDCLFLVQQNIQFANLFLLLRTRFRTS